MELNVVLTQVNKSGNVSFEAKRKLNIGENEVSHVSLEIAAFCKDISKLCKSNANLGFASAVSGIKKSLPMSITLQGLGDDDDVNVSLEYRNFGKFVENTTETKLRKFLKNNIEFAEKYSV